MRKNVLALGLLLSFAGVAAPAFAADPCEAGKWPLTREMDWFRSATLAKPGAALLPGHAAVIALQPTDKVQYLVPPSRKPADKTFGEIVSTAVATEGVYQITLSDEAWLEVVQGGKLVKVEAFTGIKECPGLRKSVRFKLAQGPAAIEIFGAAGDRLLVAVAPAE